MHKILIAILSTLFTVHLALAADAKPATAPATAGASDCAAKAAEKKLAGAAKGSFMKKCEKDSKPAGDAKAAAPAAANADCVAKAAEKKLAGAAKNSFMKKCEKDAKPAAAPAK